MAPDPHAPLRDRVVKRVLSGDGESDPALRAAAANGTGLPRELQPLIEKIHRHAYKVTDSDIAELKAKYSEDALFEIIASAALGASHERLTAGLRALDEA